MRLEDHMHAAKSALASGGERSADLGRMVAVIVNDADACGRAFKLEAAIHTAKTVEAERIWSGEMSSAVPTAMAAVAFSTLCAPGMCSVNSPRSFSLYVTWKRISGL